MKDRETGRSRGFGFVVGFSLYIFTRVLANLNWLVSLTRPTALPTRPTTPSLTWFVSSALTDTYCGQANGDRFRSLAFFYYRL